MFFRFCNHQKGANHAMLLLRSKNFAIHRDFGRFSKQTKLLLKCKFYALIQNDIENFRNNFALQGIFEFCY
jgi:hypothetical protein